MFSFNSLNKCKYLLVIITFQLSLLLTNGQDPQISFITKKQIATIGDSVTLECRTQFANHYSVNWVKVTQDNLVYLTQGANLVLKIDRYHVKYDTSTHSYNFTIDKVQEIDAGEYECRIVLGPQNIREARVNIHVRIPPVISDNSTRSIITGVNTTADFHCSASGYPQPKIFWRRDKSELLPNNRGAQFNGQSLRVYNVSKDDRGTYYCVADNGVIPGARRAISLEVEFPPEIKVRRHRIGQALQYVQDLQCTIEAFPSSNIQWFKDGIQLSNNQHYEISLFSKSDEFVDTILRVKRIENQQYGKYQCKATNKLGSTERDIELYETVNVICPPACEEFQTAANHGLSNLRHSWSIFFTIISLILATFLAAN